MTLLVPVSWGELVDKITILEIKAERIADPAKVANVRHELDTLRATMARAGRLPAGAGDLIAELKAINAALWEIEDGIRDLDARGDFGPRFVETARLVYRTNDRRAMVKREISLLMGSDILEEKSYVDPDPGR